MVRASQDSLKNERILARFAGVELAAVYAVPDSEVGDQVMAALQFANPSGFDPAAFERFLADQADLGTKWAPRYVRLTGALPVTQTSKVQKRALRAERWECSEPVYLRAGKSNEFRLIGPDDIAAITAAFERRGRKSMLG